MANLTDDQRRAMRALLDRVYAAWERHEGEKTLLALTEEVLDARKYDFWQTDDESFVARLERVPTATELAEDHERRIAAYGRIRRCFA